MGERIVRQELHLDAESAGKRMAQAAMELASIRDKPGQEGRVKELEAEIESLKHIGERAE
jgi:hypothetical protein